MNQLRLNIAEITEINTLLRTIVGRYDSAEDSAFVHESSLYAQELPRRLRAFLNDFRMREPACGWCLISGYPINEAKVGRTPSHWKARPTRSPALEEEVLLVLFGSLLGDVLGWATQQDGHLIHDVMPIKGHEDEQLGTGSEQLLTWHNEDAFHPYRGDYLSMMCLRNPDRVATNLASLNLAGLEPAQVRILFEPRFTIRPDESHLEKNSAKLKTVPKGADPGLESAFRKINAMNTRPEKLAVLYGDPRSPYLRIDPYFMDELTDDAEAQRALDALIRVIDAEVRDLVLEPGDFVFIDNFKAVHGRRAFRARYDGNDRWLKRINLARDLRKSRDARPSCESRLLS